MVTSKWIILTFLIYRSVYKKSVFSDEAKWIVPKTNNLTTPACPQVRKTDKPEASSHGSSVLTVKLLRHRDSIWVSCAHSPGKIQTLFFCIDVLVWEKNRERGVRCPCSCLLTISITVLSDIGLSEYMLWKTKKLVKKTSKVSHVPSGWHIWVVHTPEGWKHLSIGALITSTVLSMNSIFPQAHGY